MENTQAQLAQAAYQLPLPRLHQPSEPPENFNCVACITIDWLLLESNINNSYSCA